MKAAVLKMRGLPAQHTTDTTTAQSVLRHTQLGDEFLVLVGDAWLDCESEYRTFCVGRKVVTVSPYRIQDEGWSAELFMHRASWHDDAAAFAGTVLADLPESEVPPACVLDVARLINGQYAVLEPNTSWAAGLYGCDPSAVLAAVLAAQAPTDARWLFQPGESLTFA